MNEREAAEAIAGGADIIDVKNPQEGALGANFPWVIKRIREMAPKHIQVSCAVGEVPNLPGSISLAALGAASLGVDYIKVGLRGLRTPKEVSYLLKNVNKAAKECNPKIKVVAVGYADADRIDSINPLLIPEIAFKTELDVAMIDTAIKDDKNIFTFLTAKQLEKFVDSAHNLGLEAALAGSLKKQDLLIVYSLGADVAGLRGAACTNNDRVKGQITRNLVHEIAEVIKQAKTNVNIKKV